MFARQPNPSAAPISALHSGAGPDHGPSKADTLGVALLRDGVVAGDDMVRALAMQSHRRGRVTDILLSRAKLPSDQLYDALAAHWGTSVIDLARHPPDIRLIDRLGADHCLRSTLVPWQVTGGVTVIVTAQPEDFTQHRDHLTRVFGPIAMALAPLAAVEESILACRGPRLARAAENRVAERESCRNLSAGVPRDAVLAAAVIAAVIALLWPVAMLALLTGLVLVTLCFATLLKILAGVAAVLPCPPEPPPPIIARLPIVSVIVALYRESDIAPRLVRRLGRLEYPRELLDIVLVVEEDDQMTRSALADADLPPWMRVIVVPGGQIKTKPRALNFALNHCRGSIIGVYDAEDAPEPDQIKRIVQRFYQRGSDVACLQGVLDFYNPTTNWLSRCFTIEYAAWFRLILPGLERLGLPIPLGGTTLFFRRAALEDLGGWDAHNVTEDADLGIRLYRHGYRTELIDTVTGEEANCRALPWVKQRSRWIKGYMMTWATHMRDPTLLWRQLGPWKFAGVQVLMLCTLTQFVLAPVLWSLWLPWLGLTHPVVDTLPAALMQGILALMVVTEITNLALNLIGLRRSGHRLARAWVLSMHLYFPLGTLASYKAGWEVIRKPFYWDKTTHGHFDPPES